MALLALLAITLQSPIPGGGGGQADPEIVSVERLAGDVERPLLWTPLRVTLRSAAGWEGDLVAKSRFGFTIARRVRVPAGGREPVILPTLGADRVEAGAAKAEIPPGRASADVVVAVDSRLPFAADLASTEKVHYVRLEPAVLQELLATGLLEAADLVLLSDAAGLDLGGPCEGRVVKSREEAERAVTAAARIESRDAAAWQLRPAGGWVPAKRERAALLAGLYGFAGFAALAFAGRRGARATLVAAAALAVAGLAAAAFVLPRGQLYVEERAVEIARADGRETVWRLWFAVSPSPDPVVIEFPRLVRPVFASFEATDRPFTLRVEGRACRVEGLALGGSAANAFTAASARASGPAVPPGDAWERKGGVLKAASGSTSLSEPKDPDYRAWKKFLEGDVVFGRVAVSEPVDDVASPQLADARRAGRYVIRRLP